MRRLVAIVLAALLAPSLARAADAPQPPTPASTQPPLGEAAKAWAASLPQGAVATAEKRDGKWTFAMNGSPFAADHGPVPAEKVLFEIGSITKVFTAILLADAVNAGTLKLSDTLAQRLPEVKFGDPAVGAITLERLATHASCLPRLPGNMMRADAADPYAAYDDAALMEYLAIARLEKTPPCAVDYSNLGFGLLGVLVERAQGKPWATLVQEKIAGPLGMVDTVQSLLADQQARFAAPWDGDKPAQPWTFKAMAGAGALRSTLADMSRFADALEAAANGGGPLAAIWPILSQDRAEMPAVGGHVGLALLHVKTHGVETYTHGGGTGGYRSVLQVAPSAKRSAIILASNATAAPEAALASWQNPAAAPAARTEMAMTNEALDEYAGVHAIDSSTRFTFVRHGDALMARLTGQPFAPIFPSAKDEFFFKVVDAQLSFRRAADGAIEGVTLHQNGRDIPATRVPGPPPKAEFPDAATLAEYAGEYDFGAFMPGGVFTVKPGPGVLSVQLTGQPSLPVFATAKDRFEYDVVPAAISFQRDAAGKVVALTLHQNGMDMRAGRK